VDNVVELLCDCWAEGGRSSGQMLLASGTCRRARVHPRLDGDEDVADLCFEDGSVARGVRFAAFAFAD
jgi:hypothetical protein